MVVGLGVYFNKRDKDNLTTAKLQRVLKIVVKF